MTIRYIYIYIYIYCHPQTDCFVLSELFSVARHVGRSKPGSKPIQLYDRLSIRPLGQQAYHVCRRELLRSLWSNSCSVRLFTFFTLSATRVLNSFEELCIMRAAAENSFTRVLVCMCVCVCVCVHVYIYIYIKRERERESVKIISTWQRASLPNDSSGSQGQFDPEEPFGET